MDIITQKMRFRESLLKYAERHGVKTAMLKYNVHKSYIYRWRSRWLASNRDIHSLQDKSKRPRSSPRLHTEAENKIIRNLARRNPNIGQPELWFKLRERGYSRSPSGLAKALKRLGLRVATTSNLSPTCKPKPYEEMDYPGERLQIDVKHVPRKCLHPRFKDKFPGVKLYQYTAIDEFSRIRFAKGYNECSTYTSSLFLEDAIKFYKRLDITIKCVQTDNGPEFTKRFLTTGGQEELSKFEKTAEKYHIKIRHIRPHTPRHNGKVERSHREDQRLLYSPLMKEKSKRKIWSVDDLNNKLKYHLKRTNNRPMRPLDMMSPLQYLEFYRTEPELFHKKKEAKKKKAR